jgi:hypothetical protein
MRRPTLQRREVGLPLLAAALAAALILAGGLLRVKPYLTNDAQPIADIPTPTALTAITEFAVPPGGQACMSTVALTPNGDLAQFGFQPVKPTPRFAPAVELVLSAPGYRAAARVPSADVGGEVTLPIAPPRNAVIGTACFVNRGSKPAQLNGTTEPRTVARSATLVDGTSVVGDIALTFLASRPRSLLDSLGEIFGHASNLTDRLVPVWLIWILAVLVAFGVPIGMVASLYLALQEDAAAGEASATS